MNLSLKISRPLFLFLAIFSFAAPSLSAAEEKFFARHVHPLTLTPDHSRLLALNSADGRLSVFTTGPKPTLTHEIPVGLLPVSVRPRTNDEIWVVNELSDSISIVSLAKGLVIETLATGDEPGDVAFIGNHAYVTCSRENLLQVFDLTTRALVTKIPLQGVFPRSLAVSPTDGQLYVSFLHTSNGTTILPRTQAPPQVVPPDANPNLPAPPKTAKIVPVDHPQINYEVLDHDLAVVSPTTHTVTSYRGNVGTHLFSLTFLPNGNLILPNSESRNLILLEPQLRSRFAQTRLAQLTPTELIQTDLNPNPDPLFPVLDHAAADSALAQVMITQPDSDPDFLWLAAFGSDRLARFRLSDQKITSLIDLRAADSGERTAQTMRGPRGLALDPTQSHLHILNRLSHTLTTLDLTTHEILSEVPLASTPPLDPDLQLGRSYLFDARLSGNGTVSCATCHIDLERDGLAWDLGNPYQNSFSVPGAFLSLHMPDTFADREMHPMKGPMITQTLIGLAEQSKLHWRGDKPSIQSFNATFPDLLGGSLLPDDDMDRVANYLLGLAHHPNPFLNLDRNLPDQLAGGIPADGIPVFTLFDNHCSACHSLPSGTSNNIDIPSTVGSFQPLKDAPLRTVYHRLNFNPTPGAQSLSGFGLGSDGSLHQLPIGHPYQLHILDDISRPRSVREKEIRNLTAFLLAFDTGTAPAIGHTVTLHGNSTPSSEKLTALATLETQAQLENFSGVALVAHGTFQNTKLSFLYDPTSQRYLADLSTIPPQTLTQLRTALLPNDSLSFLGVPASQKHTLSIDRNRNGLPDRSEPAPILKFLPDHSLTWPADRPLWFLEFSPDFQTWHPTSNHHPNPDSPRGFFRLRRTW